MPSGGVAAFSGVVGMNRLQAYAQLLVRTGRHARFVRGKFGVPVWRQIVEMARLHRFAVGPDDYYKYALFHPGMFPDFASKTTYRGYRWKDELRRFSDPKIQGIAFHKLILYRLLEAWDLPCPRIHAVYCPVPDGFERHRALATPEELVRWLRETEAWPLFGKPSNASHGFGARGLRRREGDEVVQVTDERIGIEELVARIDADARETGPYLLSELLEPREDFRRLCGSTLPSCRLVVLVRHGEPEPMAATVLLPPDRQHFSNARGLTTGSVCAGVDLETGRLFQPLCSLGPDIKTATHHPTSGQRVDGFVIEGWREAVAMTLRASRAFSPFRMQHWDLSFTTRGPVLLELNFIGDLEPMQVAGPPGLMRPQFRSFYETHRVW